MDLARTALQETEQALKEQRLKETVETPVPTKSDVARANVAGANRATPAKPKPQRKANKRPANRIAAVAPEKRKLYKSIQTEMKRLGCYPGSIDGFWGDISKFSLQILSENTQLGFVYTEPSEELLLVLQNSEGQICPKGTHFRIFRLIQEKRKT